MTLAAPSLNVGGEPTFPDDAVEVGRVLGAWGIKGWIRVQAYAGDPQALLSSRRWFIRPPELPGPKRDAPWPKLLSVTHSRPQGDDVVAAAGELPDRNAAEAVKGARVFIARTNFPSVGEGEYYWVDLIGLAVVNRDGAALGTVTGLLDTGVHSVLRVRRPEATEATPEAEAERLIPFVAAYVDDVKLADRRITVDWGLDY